MKLLLPLVLVCVATRLQAANYYFSSSTGNDNRSFAEAQNPATPFQTIDKLNSFNLQLKPGDSILFKRGDVFYGSLVVKAVGTAAGNVYYGAYGTGAAPVISGFTPLSNWAFYKDNIYSAALDAGPMLNMVTVNGEAKGMGRSPNSGYLTYENSNGNTSITDNDLPALPNWTGAEIVIRKHRFILDRHTVTSQVGGALFYSLSKANGDNSVFSPVKGNGYFFQNHPGTLDQAGEWFYDAAGKRLYMHFGGTAPTNYVVKASTKDTNCFVTTARHLTFENLAFEGGNKKGLWLTSTKNALIKDCHFNNQGGHSLYAADVDTITVKGGTVSTSFANGIFFDNNTNACIIDGVSVYHSNSIPGTAPSSTSMSVGITVNGNGNRISNNQVRNSGYNGISFSGNNVVIEKNLVDTFCTVKDDGGGIYSYVGGSNATASNRVVRNNIVLNAVGALAGAESYSYEAYGKAAGIYLDEHANNIEITGNTVANGDWGGIFFHNAHDCIVSHNLFYNHRYQVLVSQYTAQTRNNEMKQNQYVAKTAAQETFYYRSFVPDVPTTMGTFDSNIYARPLADNKTIHLDNFWTGGNGTLYLSLAQWKAAYGLDAASRTSPLTFTGNIGDSLRFDYNATPAQKVISLTGSYLDMKGTQHAGVVALEPFTGLVLLKSSVAFLQNQVILFPAIAAKTLGDAPFKLTATATSGLTVSYRVVSGPATVAGDLLTLTDVGTVEIEAFQEGDAAFKPAPPVRQSFSVTLPKVAQFITFPPVSNKTFGDAPFTLSATTSSGLSIAYVILSGPATLNGNLLSLTGAGTVTVQALQPGNNSFLAAPAVSQRFAVAKRGQELSFSPITKKFNNGQPFAVTADASSKLPVVLRIVTGPATVTEKVITLTGGTGNVTVEAAQPGNNDYHAAATVQQTFLVERAEKLHQTITFPAIANKTYGDAPFLLKATTTSGLPVVYSVTSGPATVVGGVAVATGTGLVWIQASQPGNEDYHMANATSQSFLVTNAVESPGVRYEWVCPASAKSLFATAGVAGSTYQWQVNKNNGAGYVALTDNSFYSGSSTATLGLVAAPSSTYGYRYRCQVRSQQTTVYSAETVIRFYTVWTGAVNTDWEAAGNWGCSVVPDGATDVFIPQVTSGGPVVQGNVSCRSVVMESGAALTVKAGYTLTITGVPD